VRLVFYSAAPRSRPRSTDVVVSSAVDPLLQRYVELALAESPERTPPLTLIIDGINYIGRVDTDQAFMRGANDWFDSCPPRRPEDEGYPARVERLKWDEELVRGDPQSDIRYVTLREASILHPNGQIMRVPNVRVDLEQVSAWAFEPPSNAQSVQPG
jgi:hypothetical protein